MSDFRRKLGSFLRASGPCRLAISAAAWTLAPRFPVGAVVAIFNPKGKVLLVEHLLRTDYPWGLPGGWIERGERPDEAVRRELSEELHMSVGSMECVFIDVVSRVRWSTHPRHLGIGYWATTAQEMRRIGWEVLGCEWADPLNLTREIAPFQARVIALGSARFAQQRELTPAGSVQ